MATAPNITLASARVQEKPEVKPDPLADGKRVNVRAVYGRLIHPHQVPLEFNVGTLTPVTVDWWVRIQLEAGKLALAD